MEAQTPSQPEMRHMSTCTSVGTVTEPDCLGPCEPGTSVTLEGIVWQETEGGKLLILYFLGNLWFICNYLHFIYASFRCLSCKCYLER